MVKIVGNLFSLILLPYVIRSFQRTNFNLSTLVLLLISLFSFQIAYAIIKVVFPILQLGVVIS